MLLLSTPASPDWFASLAGLLNSFILLLLGALLTWYWKTYDARKKKEEELAKDKAQWRDGRLMAEKTLSEALAAERKAREDADNTERSERIQWQLKRETELASIAGILEESTEAHKLLATLAANTHSHSGRHDRTEADVREIRERLNRMQDHILNLLHHD